MINYCFNFAIILGLVLSSRGQAGSCKTPEGKQGVCQSLRKCSALLNVIRVRRNNSEITSSFRRHICGNATEQRVCCPVENQDVSNRQGGEEPTILPTISNCGLSDVMDNKIFGGGPVDLGAWPWIAALGYRSASRAGPNWLCSGSLINNRYIVTAAHCTNHVEMKVYVARLGEVNLNSSVNDGGTPVDYGIEKIIAHPNYDPNGKQHDIALLRLNKTVTFTKYIQPICLPKEQIQRVNKYVQPNAYVAGWGKTEGGKSSNILMDVQVPVVENSVCKKAYSGLGRLVTDKQICAGTDHKDACLGDSGGPLMLPERVNFFLVGIVSFGYNCGVPEYPGVYTRVTEYIDWITKTIY